MQDGTAEEFALIHAGETEYARTLHGRVLDAVRSLETGGAPGYAVSRLEHSLQSATRAERDGKPFDYVVAALVHDIGDSLAPYSHGSYAAAVLRPFVSEELCWVISHHPLFQMYYYGPHMGGDSRARDQFRGHPWFDATEGSWRGARWAPGVRWCCCTGCSAAGPQLADSGPARALAAQGYRVILPDLRGHGDSARPHDLACYPPDVLADDGLALIAHLGLDGYDLGGYSLGGYSLGGRLV